GAGGELGRGEQRAGLVLDEDPRRRTAQVGRQRLLHELVHGPEDVTPAVRAVHVQRRALVAARAEGPQPSRETAEVEDWRADRCEPEVAPVLAQKVFLDTVGLVAWAGHDL